MRNEFGRVIEDVAQWAASKQHISAVHFYGSRVRGDFFEDSDIDVAVTLIAENADSAFAYFSLYEDSWRDELSKILSPWRVDLQWHHHEATHIVQAGIAKSNILVYTRLSGAAN